MITIILNYYLKKSLTNITKFILSFKGVTVEKSKRCRFSTVPRRLSKIKKSLGETVKFIKYI